MRPQPLPATSGVTPDFYPTLLMRSDAELALLIDQITLSPELLNDLNQFLVSNLLSIRFNALVDLEEIGAIWERIREHQYLTDLVIDHATALSIHANTLEPDGWNKLVEIVAQGWGSFNRPNVVASDSVVKFAKEEDRFLDPSKAAQLIHGNPWLLSLHFLRLSEHVRGILKQAADRAVTQWQAQQSSATQGAKG